VKDALIGALIGALLAAGASAYITRAIYQRQALAAQKETSDLKAALATARADLAEANTKLSNVLLEERDEKQKRIDGIASNLDSLTNGMRYCARKSDVSVTLAPSGAIEAVSGKQLRDLSDVVAEVAKACVVGRDRDAIDHNKLIDWFERLPKTLEAH
jgi:hypothetical protein